MSSLQGRKSSEHWQAAHCRCFSRKTEEMSCQKSDIFRYDLLVCKSAFLKRLADRTLDGIYYLCQQKYLLCCAIAHSTLPGAGIIQAKVSF